MTIYKIFEYCFILNCNRLVGSNILLEDFPDRLYWIDILGEIPSRCIERFDVVHGGRAIFHGCYDWHSSVHGHWAVFRSDLTGTGKNHDLAVKVCKRFSVEKIDAVIKELKSEPTFETPYGRAWLLRLAIEFDLWSKRYGVDLPSNWRILTNYVADSLLDYYLEGPERAPNIYSNQYRNDSFSIVQLHDYLQYHKEEKLKDVLIYVSRNFLNDGMVFDPKLETDPNAFLSPFWSWVYLLTKTQPLEIISKIIRSSELSKDILNPVVQREVDPKKVHHYGMNWSRAWAIKSLARKLPTEESNFLVTAYHKHIKHGLKTHEDISQIHLDKEEKDAYYSYYHWVPQFGIYAITE